MKTAASGESAQLATSRVARDAQGERSRYEDIPVGHDLGQMTWTVTAEMVAKQCAMDGDYDPAYQPGGGGAQLAPPQILYRPPRWLLSRNFNIRGVLYKWSFAIENVIEVGREMTLSGRISAKWIKSEREFVEYEVRAHYADDGTPVFATKRVHVLDVIERNQPREGEGLDSGKKSERI
jgi:hypothetical protein